jgi:rod shape-determining protein MreD
MKLSNFKRIKYLRRILLGLLVFLAAMAQNVPWLPVVFGVHALPLLPITISIAVLDQSAPAILIGAFAGLLLDYNGAGLGFHAVTLTGIAFTTAMLMRYFLNRNWRTISLLMFCTALGDAALRWLSDAFGRPDALWFLLHRTLPSLAYTLLISPVCYLLVYFIVRKTSRKQRGVCA